MLRRLFQLLHLGRTQGGPPLQLVETRDPPARVSGSDESAQPNRAVGFSPRAASEARW